MNQNELAHYGVLGMKWGVRKNPEKAATKSLKKLKKLDTKASRKAFKSDEAEKKYDAARTKALNYKMKGKRAKYNKQQEKAELAEFKYLKKKKPAVKAIEKANSWVSSMNKTFSNQSLGSLPSKYSDLGRKYTLNMFS